MTTAFQNLPTEERIQLIIKLKREQRLGDIGLRKLLLENPSVYEANSKSEICTNSSLSAVDFYSPDYPAAFDDLRDKPMLVYMHGDKSLVNKECISIVGTRSPNETARKYTFQLAKALAEQGFVVVSGFARGIDTAAHSGAMQAGGGTIAILAEGVHTAITRSNIQHHKDLCAYIGEKGLFISEKRPRYKSQNRRDAVAALMMRNRLIAAMSSLTIVAASRAQGGAIHTANRARKLGRRVLTVDWPNQEWGGNLRLILGGAETIPAEPSEATQVIIKLFSEIN